MAFQHLDSEGTLIGQVAIFVTIIIKAGIDIVNERRMARKLKEKELADAAKAAELAKKLEAEHAATREQMTSSLQAVRKRLNGLIEPEEGEPPHSATKPSTPLTQTPTDLQQLESFAQGAAPISPAGELKRRIIKVMKDAFVEYYDRWPDRLVGERAKDAQRWSLRGIHDIIEIVDDYDIERRK